MDPTGSRTAEPQFSPDGAWWWDGRQWNAVTPAPAHVAPAARQAAVQQAPQQGAAPAVEYFGAAVPQPMATVPQPIAVPAHAAPQAAERDGYAIASLVLGVLWIFGVGSLGAVVLGHLSNSEAVRKGRPKSGLAVAGLVLGYLGSAFFVLGVLAAIVIPTFLNQRQKADSVDVKAAVTEAAAAEEEYFTTAGTYTGDLGELGLPPAGEGVTLRVISVSDTTYCIAAGKGPVIWWYGSATGLSTRPCA